jgi:hypothetical protein
MSNSYCSDSTTLATPAIYRGAGLPCANSERAYSWFGTAHLIGPTGYSALHCSNKMRRTLGRQTLCSCD